MNTSFTDIYRRFLRKVEDWGVVELSNEDAADIMFDYLLSAMAKFTKCRKDLDDFDQLSMSFNFKLTNREIEILSALMVVEWLTPFINSTQNTRQYFGSKEEKFFSQKNFLEGLENLQNNWIITSKKLIRDYVNSTSSALEEL